ncbi:hypothetical protein ACE11G_02570 [Gordonia sp. PS3]|uniref:hypothetical protein n=1 Tax=unclassified Gordonia (in: high G+C Gram-positive bacteria) TaxID=2657482 RepID=UPI0035C23395
MTIDHIAADRPACGTRLRYACLTLCALPLLAGCSSGGTEQHDAAPPPPPNEAAILNDASPQSIIDTYRRGGLQVSNDHDTTATACGEAHCQAAAATDQVTVMQFSTTREATTYHQTHPDTFLVENIVVTLPSATPADARAQYEHLTTMAVE